MLKIENLIASYEDALIEINPMKSHNPNSHRERNPLASHDLEMIKPV